MSKSTGRSSPRETSFSKAPNLPRESSHGPKIESPVSRDLSKYLIDCIVEPSSPGPRSSTPRNAQGDLSNARQNLPLSPVSHHTSNTRQTAPDIWCRWVRECSGQGETPLQKKGGITDIRGYSNLDDGEVSVEWGNIDNDDEWSIIDEPVDKVDGSEALQEPLERTTERAPVDNACIEKLRSQRPKVHPRFAARYENDSAWGSMTGLGYESRWLQS